MELDDGQVLPLADCDWIMWAPCGCACGVTVAEFRDGEALTTAEAVWKDWYPNARERLKRREQGFTLTLISHARYAEEVLPKFQGDCPHTPTWGIPARRQTIGQTTLM